MALLDVESDAGENLYRGAKLLLSRPDQHVAWRGSGPPADAGALIDLVRGAAISSGWELP